MPLGLVPEMAVFLEGASLGVKEAVGIDEVKDVGVLDFEVIEPLMAVVLPETTEPDASFNNWFTPLK